MNHNSFAQKHTFVNFVYFEVQLSKAPICNKLVRRTSRLIINYCPTTITTS